MIITVRLFIWNFAPIIFLRPEQVHLLCLLKTASVWERYTIEFIIKEQYKKTLKTNMRQNLNQQIKEENANISANSTAQPPSMQKNNKDK